jgi:hypothetical protein
MRAAAVGVLVVVVAVGVFASTTVPTFAHNTGARCGHELWDLKTLSDPGRNLIYTRPRLTTVIAINARRMPRRTPMLRSRGYERHVWRLVAQITNYKLEQDGDIHMILFDKSDYMIAEMPAAHCLPSRTRYRRAIINTRHLFESRCGRATKRWRDLGAVVHLQGVGFWDFPHGQRGHARNYAELHPLTRIRFIAGCGA